MGNKPGRFYEFGEFLLDLEERVLRRGDRTIHLQPRLFDLLAALARNSGRLLEKEELMQMVWPDTFVEEVNLARNISDLRKLLGDDRSSPAFIETIPKRGYRFIARVHEPRSRDESPPEKSNVISFASHANAQEAADRDETQSIRASGNLLLAPSKESSPASAQEDEIPLSDSAMDDSRDLPRSRRRARLVAAAALTLIIAGAAIAYRILTSEAREPFREMKITRLTETSRVASAVISPDGRHVAYVLKEAEGQSLWIKQVAAPGAVRIVAPVEAEYWGVTFSPDGDYIYYVLFESRNSDPALYQIPALGGVPAKLPVVTNSPVSFSPDGKRLAYTVSESASGGTCLYTANADGTDKKILLVVKDPDFFIMQQANPAWSPDGRMIACGIVRVDGEGVRCSIVGVRVEDGEMITLSEGKWPYVGQIAWLAGGDEIVFIGVEPGSSLDQIWRLSLASGEVRRVTNDLNENRGVSLTSDGKALVTVQTSSVSSFWVVDSGKATKLPLDAGSIEQMAILPDNQIVYRSTLAGSERIRIVGMDGVGARQLPVEATGSTGLAVSPDGKYIIFSSHRAGKPNLWRMSVDGSDLARLTEGDGELRPSFTPDGNWIVYQHGFGDVKTTLWKISVDGGEVMQVTDMRMKTPSVSPDGRMIAGFFMDSSDPQSPWRAGVISFEGGAMIKKFDMPATFLSNILLWTPDGKALAYINEAGNVSNVWIQPLDGGPPKQFTDFNTDRVVAFAWTQDGRRLVCARAVESSYAALINDFR